MDNLAESSSAALKIDLYYSVFIQYVYNTTYNLEHIKNNVKRAHVTTYLKRTFRMFLKFCSHTLYNFKRIFAGVEN